MRAPTATLALPGGLSLSRAARPAAADADEVARARAGELAAFEGLYRRYEGRIFALCRRMTGETAAAEDLTQEAFVRAWQKLATFRGESGFYTWLHRLTVNLVVSHLRSRGRWRAREVEAEPPELERHAARRREPGAVLDLERAIDALPPQARTVFVLYDVEGYRHREIAAMTGLAEGTSKAHLHRARRALRKALRP